MIVRNIKQDIVNSRWYVAHRGAAATMLFAAGELEGILFFAHAELKPGKKIEEHTDVYEEIYYFIKGSGLMRVGDEEQQVEAGDAAWLPYGIPHSLYNNGNEDCIFVVAAAVPAEMKRLM
jgi:mannose-6-phosphate isomerase-like protein (cupin superfamily)